MIPATSTEAHPLPTTRKMYRGVMPDAYYDALGRCETGGKRGNLRHATRNYTGAYGIYRGTARRWSGTPTLAHMSRKKQIRIADRIAFRGWTNKRGEYVHPVGPFGWGAVTSGCGKLASYLCHATHKLAQKHRRRGCQIAGQHG